MMKRALGMTLICTMLATTALGCGSQGTESGKSSQASSQSSGQASQGSAESQVAAPSERTTYKPSFTASGSEAADYNAKLERFEKSFIKHYTETGELAKVEGYEEPLAVTSINWFNAAGEETMAKNKEKFGESLMQNRFADAFKRLYNVDQTYNWLSQDGDYNQKLQLDITSGELPDVFLVRRRSDLADLARQGLIWDLTEVMDQYASEYDKKVWQSDNGLALQMATFDGKIYGMPSIQSATDAVSYLWVRDDWMKKLKLEYPKTLDDLKKVEQAFVSQDPDGNGQADTWGMIMDSSIIYPSKGIFAAYGSYPDYWHKASDGSVVYGGTTENTKNALAYLNDLYKSGLINPEFITMNGSKAAEGLLNGKVGLVYGGHWYAHTIGDLHELDANTDWRSIDLPSLDGSPVKSMLTPTNQGWVVVRKDFKNPEVIFKMRSLHSYSLYCEDSAWWNYDNNVSWHWSPVRCNVSAFDNYDTYVNLQEAYSHNNDESLLKAKGVPYWANLHGKDQWEWEKMFGPGEGTAFSVLKKTIEKDNLMWDSFHGEQSEDMQSNWSTITSERNQAFTNIIIGKVSVEEGFAQWLKTWENLKGKEITEYVNKWCKENEVK